MTNKTLICSFAPLRTFFVPFKRGKQFFQTTFPKFSNKIFTVTKTFLIQTQNGTELAKINLIFISAHSSWTSIRYSIPSWERCNWLIIGQDNGPRWGSDWGIKVQGPILSAVPCVFQVSNSVEVGSIWTANRNRNGEDEAQEQHFDEVGSNLREEWFLFDAKLSYIGKIAGCVIVKIAVNWLQRKFSNLKLSVGKTKLLYSCGISLW